MNFMKLSNPIRTAALSAGILLGASSAAFADSITVSYLAPGVQNPSAITSNYETFNSATVTGGTITTNFAGSGITGVYSGTFSLANAGLYGGAGGTGKYITTPNIINSTYTLTLSSSVNYFGYWLSALDMGNQVQLYNGSTLLFTYTPSDLIAALGACTTSGGYCGNPTDGYLNGSQQYAYLDFYDNSATFNKIVFTETIANAGYESDNHAVALLGSAPVVGTVLGATPEPSSLVLLGTGVLGVAASMRRKIAGKLAQ
jgi:hypothetical protein